MQASTTTNLTSFHITHWKAGSQWIKSIVRRLEPDRLATGPGVGFLGEEDVRAGSVHSPVYMHRAWFYRVAGDAADHRRVVVIRDLRDATVSWYFSIRHSHPRNAKVDEFREKLGELPLEDGLLLVLGESTRVMARIQSSWLAASEDERLLVRYEDLIGDTPLWMGRVLDRLGVNDDAAAREAAIQAESFEAKTGRKRGQEDVSHHERKGVAGDWQNHFTPRLKDRFKENFGQLLIDTGYETDLNW